MALTRITKGVIKPNENYDTHNIHSTGIVTAIGLDINGNADVSGSLSVGGVLTYEDVTSIDSVGIITARTGLVSPYADIDDFVSVGNNIHLGNAGVITATSFVGDGSGLIGVASTDNIVTGTAATFTGGVDINSDLDVDGHTELDNLKVSGIGTFGEGIFLPDNKKAEFGNAAGNANLEIFHDGSNHSYVRTASSSAGGIIIKSHNDLQIRTDNLQIKTNSLDDILTSDINGNVSIGNSLTVAGVSTFNSGIFLPDNQKALFGNTAGSSDLEIYHDGNHNIFKANNGQIRFNNNVFQVYNQGGNNIAFEIVPGSKTKLFFGTSNKLETANTGVVVSGILTATDLDIDGHTNLDNVSIAGVTTTTGNLNVGGYVVSQGTSGKGGIFGQIEVGYDNTYLTVQPTSGHNDLHLNFDNGSTVQIGHNSPSTLTVNGNIVPKTDSARDLGLTGTRFRAAYVDTYYGDGSNLTGITGTTINSNTNNYLITGTGTANTLQGESNLIFDGATLKVGNNENPSNYNSGADNILIGNHSGHGGITILSGTTSGGYIMFSDNNGGGSNAYRGQIEYQHGGSDADHMRFITDSTEHLRISSEGQLKISGTDINSSTDMKHGYESGGGTSNSIYINRANSTFDWKGGMVMRGVGGTWGLRISAQGSMNTSSDTQGEIFGVHPVEPTNPTNAQSTYQDNVDDAYFRVMGNAKIFATVPIYQSGSRPFYFNSVAVTSNETITTSYNAMSVGNIQINSGNTVTVQSGARWVIV